MKISRTVLKTSLDWKQFRLSLTLTRLGFDLIEWIIERSGGKVVALKQTDLSQEQELTTDLLSILHVFSCPMHGLRNYKSQVRQALSEPKTKKDV